MHILIVDDERNIRFTLRDILEDEGHKCTLAESGEEALRILEEASPNLIILDILLPGMDGIETFQRIKENAPEVDVIMISGHSDIETAVKGVKLGAYDFLEKPLSMAKLLTAIRNVEEKQALLNRLQQDEAERFSKYEIVGESPQIKAVQKTIDQVAPTNSRVFIRGESGTGKELVAYAIHHKSSRKDKPFITFNSAAIPDTLVESELFGYEKGAFTGAESQRQGKLEQAHSGTLFLDEIGDMDVVAQAKILRVIQEGTLERVGGRENINIDVRILAATNKYIEQMIADGTFREDLFYRLNVVPIEIPPLREREGDINLLTKHFLNYFAAELKMKPKTFGDKAVELLKNYHFPGNVRELQNLIERLYITVHGKTISGRSLLAHLSPESSSRDYPFLHTQSFRDAKKQFDAYYIAEQLKRYSWNISRTAGALGMHQPNLSRKIKELGIKKPGA